jgi:hypothetical protein
MDQTKRASVSLTVQVASFIAFLIWCYVQMRHWREPGIDAMALATNICVTLLLWALLIAAIVLNRKEAHESKSARAKTLNVEYECATKIEQAKREVLKARSDLDDERKRLEREVSRKPGYIKGGAIKGNYLLDTQGQIWHN